MVYSISFDSVTPRMMLYENAKPFVITPDVDTIFYIKSGVLQYDSQAYFHIVIRLDCALIRQISSSRFN